MSQWNHAICDTCWAHEHPDGRVPYRLNAEYREREVCCFCGLDTMSGIYVRRDPRGMACAHAPREEG